MGSEKSSPEIGAPLEDSFELYSVHESETNGEDLG